MLANGAKLYYSETEPNGAGSYTELPGLKEIPEMGVDPEKVNNTGLNDVNQQYEMGIGELPDTQYVFKFPSNKTEWDASAYKKGMEWQKSNQRVWFKEVLKDGTETKFSGKCSAKRTGGGVNGVIDAQLNIAIDSDLEITQPAS